MGRTVKKIPLKMGKRTDVGYGRPPKEHRIKPGEVRNPNGRPPAGLKLKEWLNIFASQSLGEDELRAIAKDKTASWDKRAAACRALRTLENPDLAEFEGYVAGQKTLDELRQAGIDTTAVKKVKERRQVTRCIADGKQLEETVTREIELHDRAGEDFDRICDRTDGKPKQSMDVNTSGDVRFTLDIGNANGDAGPSDN